MLPKAILKPAATPTPSPTWLPPTATNTPTEVPPTATSSLTAIPPTATNTPTEIPPTATNTPTAIPPTATPTPTPEPVLRSTTIDYGYDPLGRLISADYTHAGAGSPGEFFHYTYDSVGNRLTQDTQAGTNTYAYDAANRLIELDGTALQWDVNGNLLRDQAGATYNYDHQKRLVSVEMGGSNYAFAYNGLGDRVQQGIDGVISTYALDLNAGLTQVLSDGTNAYLYGLGRIGEEQPSGWAYHLPDALGSVRQLADASGAAVLAKTYEPFGSPLSTGGQAASSYGFTGEWTDATGLVHLRARYYQPEVGRFFQPDPFSGLSSLPRTIHPYVYGLNNPLRYTDPSGQFAFIPLLLVAAAGGFLGGLSYYALQPLLDKNRCWQWDWGEAILWTSIGTGIGATIGVVIYGGWWIGVQLGIWGPGAVALGGKITELIDVTKQEMALLVRNVDLSQAVERVRREVIGVNHEGVQVIKSIISYYINGEYVATIHKITTLAGEIMHMDFKDIVIEGIKYIVRSW